MRRSDWTSTSVKRVLIAIAIASGMKQKIDRRLPIHGKQDEDATLDAFDQVAEILAVRYVKCRLVQFPHPSLVRRPTKEVEPCLQRSRIRSCIHWRLVAKKSCIGLFSRFRRRVSHERDSHS